jgi:hypothetical protein
MTSVGHVWAWGHGVCVGVSVGVGVGGGRAIEVGWVVASYSRSGRHDTGSTVDGRIKICGVVMCRME